MASDSSKPSIKHKIIGNLLLLIAVVLLGFAVKSAWDSYSECSDWQHSEGKVIRVLRKTSATGRRGRRVTNYTPIFRFTAQGERFPRTITSEVSIPLASFNEGETVDVIYPANAPEQARINSPMQLYYNAGLAGVIGLFLLLVGLSIRHKSAKPAGPGSEDASEQKSA